MKPVNVSVVCANATGENVFAALNSYATVYMNLKSISIESSILFVVLWRKSSEEGKKVIVGNHQVDILLGDEKDWEKFKAVFKNRQN